MHIDEMVTVERIHEFSKGNEAQSIIELVDDFFAVSPQITQIFTDCSQIFFGANFDG